MFRSDGGNSKTLGPSELMGKRRLGKSKCLFVYLCSYIDVSKQRGVSIECEGELGQRAEMLV